MTDGTVDVDDIAVVIVCEECGELNWRKRPQLVMLCDLAESNFVCEECSRQLGTDAGVISDD